MADILKITYTDGRTVDVPVTPRGEVEFERTFDLPFFEVNNRRERPYWLAWRLLSLKGEETRDFDVFLDNIDEVEVVKNGTVPPDPTQPTPRSADSSDSPSPSVT